MFFLRYFYSIQAKLITAVSTFILLIVGAVVVNAWLDRTQARAEEAAFRLSIIDQKLHEADKLEALFFTDDASLPDFYVTGKSHHLTLRRETINRLLDELDALESDEMNATLRASAGVDRVRMLYNAYESAFEDLVTLVKRRGYLDYGLEGKFRKHIHEIEFVKAPIDRAKLLAIRQHEKDFIIRRDLRYLPKLEKAVEEFRQDLYKQRIDPILREQLEQHLDEYQQKFIEFVWVEEAIGLHGDQGLRDKLSDISAKLESQILSINQQVLADVERIRRNTRWGAWGITVVFLASGVALAMSILRWLGAPIQKLSASIHEVVESNFALTEAQVPLPEGRDEIGRLSHDFTVMLRKVHESLGEVREQSRQVQEKQEQLLDSIRYAQQIQHAILPSTDELREAVADHFILYRPQQVVSGDFYWHYVRGNLHFFALADCTGHGVPGAFMSMIGNTLLNKLVVQAQVVDPSTILEGLHTEVVAALRQHSGQRNNDGMDVGLCCWERQPNGTIQLAFAGAKQNLLYLEPGGTMERLTGVKRSVGGTVRRSKHKPFETRVATVTPGTRLYFHTDGFPDQQNDAGDKFGSPALAELLTRLAPLPMHEQRFRLEEALAKHQQRQQQRDDITLIGLQL
jgi:serine phosphatase RsbU (regulator of sigma subunit)